MSVIAVKKYKDKIVIASDSQTTFGENKEIKENTTKLVKINENLIVGSSGYSRTILLFEMFCETNQFKSSDKMEILRFFNAFEVWLSQNTVGCSIKQNSFFLIANKKVFHFNDYYLEEVKNFDAIGSGGDKALAILSYLNLTKQETDLKDVLEAVSQIDLYCHTPIKSYTVKL